MTPSTAKEPKKRGRPAGKKSANASPGSVQSLARGINLLKCLAVSEDGASLADLAQQVGLAPSTTHRLLISFQEQQFVRNDPLLSKWYIDVGAFIVGNAFLQHRDYLVQSRPLMHELVAQSGETANLAIMEEGEAVFISQVESREMMRMVVRMGSRAPLHASGVGKAFLATMKEQEVREILHQHGLPRVTENTITSPDLLKESLDHVRSQGYAVDDEEHAIGLRCVASTIHNELGEPLAALSLSGPKARIPDARIPQLGLLVFNCASEITRLIGGVSSQ